ncbi:Protein kinase-like domain [Pseudocohnilembus persalinus]|uniref:Cyclin-dependent kinase 2 homolog n=1 Tax=Pseudocohnilembus persalinus TaxID=266149 RepID=A0A0V0R5J4_PSEPJ|nr:Protein kinase-like domain [Pseudocohnilembus persalinus]|eukprot:KRX09464.1 Protein kinase-like domain [Pseudocohnilembus persalinus]
MNLRYAELQNCQNSIKLHQSLTNNNNNFEVNPLNKYLPEELKEYQVEKLLGEGTYGKVFKIINPNNNKELALKIIKLENLSIDGFPQTALREISILKSLSQHPNIVKQLMFYQLLSAVGYCHRKRILHRDIKPQNILIDKNGQVKLADFGLAREFSLPLKQLTKEVETLWYRGPELLLGSKVYSFGLDSWSLGCVLYEIHTNNVLFCSESQIEQLFKIFQLLGTPQQFTWTNVENLPYFLNKFPQFFMNHEHIRKVFQGVDQQTQDLILKFIEIDPVKRINVFQALEHSYFNEIKQEDKEKYGLKFVYQ